MNKVFYILFFIGLVMWQGNLIMPFVNGVKARLILRQNLKKAVNHKEIKEYKGFFYKIERLIKVTRSSKLIPTPEIFICISGILGFLGMSIGFFIDGVSLGVIFGLFLLLLPAGILLLKLNSKRAGSSREGEIMIQELLTNYKVYDYNMKEALERTAANIEDAPNSKRILTDLVESLNKSFTKEEIHKVLENLKYSIGTSWGSALASNIYFAQVHGIKVTDSLEDLAVSITNSRKLIEHSRREHNEANLMLKYLAPISYVLSIICACKYFGFTLGKFFAYQFTSALGLRWFLIMIMIYASGLLVNSLLSKEKMDL